ncbi:helix-turn-helix domain-containing protein [Stenotrophomonas maltophilia]|nr:helix-turn-helix domain-containing protein [Stenotrophomonas maltophilia]
MHKVHIIKIMHPASHPATAALVKRARVSLGLNQAGFGRLIGRSQGVVSRYEKGLVAPPGDVMMHCMNILGGADAAAAPLASIDDLVQALEGALALVRSMRDRQVDLT